MADRSYVIDAGGGGQLTLGDLRRLLVALGDQDAPDTATFKVRTTGFSAGLRRLEVKWPDGQPLPPSHPNIPPRGS